jgi:glycosyltransferase involved in cell wall biosynthesis
MKIICLGNYLPRQCGIATFTENLVKAILHAAQIQFQEVEIEVIAMDDTIDSYPYPEIVKKTIPDQDVEAYVKMAEYINGSGADLLLLQHEYGIFGGESGLHLLALLRRVKIPIVCTFHTVLEKPSFHQAEVLRRIALYASRVIIMNRIAIDFLVRKFHVAIEKIALIEHGVPDFEANADRLLPAPANWEGRKIMMTFGLIGRSKGIETVLRALPSIVALHPDVLYVVLGKTHPHVLRHSGEEYRDYLKSLVKQYKLDNHVVFINQYVSELELMSLLKAADLYVTPYLNKAQITSGTLCYAVSGGCAVFSTPYWHAVTLLDEERGWLFDFGNHNQLASLVNKALDDPETLALRQQKAFDYGKTITWPQIGKAYLDVFNNAIDNPMDGSVNRQPEPVFDIAHLLRLTDETGIFQHADGLLPSYRNGYCLDDNARAMLLVIKAYKREPLEVYLKLLTTYFSFLRLMVQKDGRVKNFLTFERQQLENDQSDDAYGRAIWALGYLIRYAPNDALFQTAMDTFHTMMMALDKLNYARGYANCIFGIYHYSKRFPDQERFLFLMDQIAQTLCHRFDQHKRENWYWCEDSLSYDNGLIPASLYLAFSATGKEEYLQVAEKSRIFLESKCFRHEWLSLLGNKKWLRFDSDYELFAQQPIDATAMIIMYKSALLATGNEAHITRLLSCYRWFIGDNDLDICVFDRESKGCNDGMEQGCINRNQGAESTIAWLLSQLIVKPFLE